MQICLHLHTFQLMVCWSCLSTHAARYGIHAAATLALTGFILSVFALIFIVLAWFSWFFTFMSSAANFCAGQYSHPLVAPNMYTVHLCLQ